MRAEELEAELPLERRPPNELDAIALEAMAYAQDGVLGNGEVAKQHFWLLERWDRLAINRGRLDEAEDCFQRAMEINKEVGDEMFQLSTLNNLAVAFGQAGNVAKRRPSTLNWQRPSSVRTLTNPPFRWTSSWRTPVRTHVVVVERRRVDPQKDQRGSDEEGTGVRWVRRVHVPVKFSKEFDVSPEEVLRRDRTMRGVIAGAFANAGHRALAKG